MPVRIRRTGKRYQVTNGGQVTARGTSLAKAKKQARLLRAVEHGWKPSRRK